MEGQRLTAYELRDTTGLIKTEGHASLSSDTQEPLLSEKSETLADGAFSVGGFQSLHDLANCGGCQANQETCMCTLRSGVYRLSRRWRVK